MDFQTGPDTEGVDTTVKFIATKTVGLSAVLQRLQLNLSWTHNAGRLPSERRDRFAGVLGYSRSLGPDTMLVADFVREQEREKGKTANILEAGMRRQLDLLTGLTIGMGGLALIPQTFASQGLFNARSNGSARHGSLEVGGLHRAMSVERRRLTLVAYHRQPQLHNTL